MKIIVKQHHIDHGVPGKIESCALALAYREQTGHSCFVTAEYDIIEKEV